MKPKPSIRAQVRKLHARNLADKEMARILEVSIQRVTATRKAMGLRPHVIIKGKKYLDYTPPGEGKLFRPGMLVSEAQIAELYAGRRY